MPRTITRTTTPTVTVDRTIISQPYYEKVTEKDTTIRKVVEEVRRSAPEITEKVPRRITKEVVGGVTITEVDFIQKSFTIVQEKTGEIKTIKSQPIPEKIKPTVLETSVTEYGQTVITSTTVEEVEKIVPEVKTAVVELTKQV